MKIKCQFVIKWVIFFIKSKIKTIVFLINLKAKKVFFKGLSRFNEIFRSKKSKN